MRSSRTYTIAQAARRLELTEYQARKLFEGVEPAGKGAHAARVYHEADVVAIARRLRLGDYERDYRRVVVHHALEPQATALEVAGLHVELVRNMLEALSCQKVGLPIIVFPANLAAHDAEALEVVIDSVHPVLVGPGELRARTRMRAECMDHDELRRLVRHAWMLVEQRVEQTKLKL